MTKEIELSQGKFSLVDDEDYDLINYWKWSLGGIGYAMRRHYIGKISGKYKYSTIYLHDLVLPTPDWAVIDHINGNPLDNRKENLRFCRQEENVMNRKKGEKKTSSKYKGVSYRKDRNKWLATILSLIHISEPTRRSYISCAVFCLKK